MEQLSMMSMGSGGLDRFAFHRREDCQGPLVGKAGVAESGSGASQGYAYGQSMYVMGSAIILQEFGVNSIIIYDLLVRVNCVCPICRDILDQTDSNIL